MAYNLATLTDRKKKALATLKKTANLDTIYDIIDTGDYVEFIGAMGGDALCFRVYNNGSVCEK